MLTASWRGQVSQELFASLSICGRKCVRRSKGQTTNTLVNRDDAFAICQHVYNYCMKRQRQKVRIVMDGERPGDHTAISMLWKTQVDGFITSMRITLSGIAAAELEVVSTEVKAVGGSENIMSGEVWSGEV